jgi:hypothetical protein
MNISTPPTRYLNLLAGTCTLQLPLYIFIIFVIFPIQSIRLRPIVAYGCETWILSVRDVKNLVVLERHILRRIYGPVQSEQGWRTSNNDELDKLMKGEDVVKYIRVQGTKWWGHLERMEKTKTVRKITEWNSIGMRYKGCRKK